MGVFVFVASLLFPSFIPVLCEGQFSVINLRVADTCPRALHFSHG